MACEPRAHTRRASSVFYAPFPFQDEAESHRVLPQRAPKILTTPAEGERAAGLRARLLHQGWLAWALIAAGSAMVPWMWLLATQLPSTTQVSHWSAAWVGLDLLIAVGLLGTGALFARGDQRHGLLAAATGGLLLVDAWFDVLTAAPGAQQTLAITLAAGAELPLAVLCAALAARAVPSGKGTRH